MGTDEYFFVGMDTKSDLSVDESSLNPACDFVVIPKRLPDDSRGEAFLLYGAAERG